MPDSGNLNRAKKAKNDEFYTRYEDIERELRNYKSQLEGKTVYCNCDDPHCSNFFRYFVDHFNDFRLRRLICTNYRNDYAPKAYKAEVHEVPEGFDHDTDDLFSLPGNSIIELDGDGDFRSEECVRLLDESDVVATNPPFSLFREYVAHLVEHGKGFLVIGSMSAVTYKTFFPLLMGDEVWVGTSKPKDFTAADGTTRSSPCYWYTNLDVPRRHEALDLTGNLYHGNEGRYPRYDNYDAIEVSKVKDIPKDYGGVMGVPVTFMDKWCPEQFEVLGICASHGKEPRGIENESPYMDGRWVYPRVLIHNRHPEG